SALYKFVFYFLFSSRRRHTRSKRDWSSDVCSSDLVAAEKSPAARTSVHPGCGAMVRRGRPVGPRRGHCSLPLTLAPKKTKNPNPSPIGKRFRFSWFGSMEGTRTPGLLIRSRLLALSRFLVTFCKLA